MNYKITKHGRTCTVSYPKGISARRFCKKWNLDIEATLNGIPMEFELVAEEYNDGTEIRIWYKHDDTYEGPDYDKYEIKRGKTPLTARKLKSIFKEYVETYYEEVTGKELLGIATEIVDKQVSHIMELFVTKGDCINIYPFSVEFHESSITEIAQIDDRRISANFYYDNVFKGMDEDRLAVKLANAFLNVLLEENPSPISVSSGA